MNYRLKLYSCLLLGMSGTTSVDSQVPAQFSAEKARNVILIIGDGMGLAHLSYLSYSADNQITVESFPVVGLQKTHSASHIITDSGAAATAMACGVKTYNSGIGIDSDSTPCRSLIELAKVQGKLTGIVVTSSIVHATPAAFIAHQRLRGFYEAIADNLVKLQVDYFVGGGRMYFTNRYSDDRDLVEELKALDYTISGYDRKSFRTFSNRLDRRMAYFTAHAEPLPYMQGRDGLSEVVDHALRMLSSQGDNGFFLMVEASQIDYASHSNDEGYLLTELQDMNSAVKVAMEFAKLHEDTLVIVTADHECGDLVLQDTKPDRKVNIEFMSRNHTSTMVPVFALGPGSEMFSGIYENTEIFSKIRSVAGY